MPTPKAGEENIRKLTKLGNKSLAVSLPIELVRDLGWKEHQKVQVKRVPRGLLIKDWRNPAKKAAQK